MKKLVLAVAAVMLTMGAFAQVNNFKPAKFDRNALSLKSASTEIMRDANKIIPLKSYAEGTTPLCDFSDPSMYTFGTLPDHTSDKTWELLDNNCDHSTYWTLHYWRSDAGVDEAAMATWVDGFEPAEDPWIHMDINNGFAGYDMYNVAPTDATDAYIKINTPITTTGSSLDICFVQMLLAVWNADKYFLEYSFDPNFAEGSYGQIAFNVKNVDATAGDVGNSNLYDRKVVNIPTGTANCDIATANQQLYIRLRLKAPAHNGPADQQVQGCQWFVDNISYAFAPDARVEVVSYSINDGYRKYPEILTPEGLRNGASIQNTGSKTATNVKLQNSFYNLTVEGEGEEAHYVYNFMTSHDSDTTFDELVNDIFTVYPYRLDNGEPDVTRPVYQRFKDVAVSDHAIPQPNQGAGAYGFVTDIKYTIDGEEYTSNIDTMTYRVSSEDVSRPRCYTWQKDIGILMERFSGVWNYYYYPTDNTYGSGTEASADGYRVCLAYTAWDATSNGSVYLSGVEVVPAMDSCQAGATIKASLWYWAGGTMAAAVLPVLDDEDNPIESAEYTLTAADLNNADPADAAAGTRTRYDDGEYNTVFMPFTKQYTPIEDTVTYYACYEKVGSQGKFYVGKDYDNWNSYSADNAWSILVWSANCAGSQAQYDWGYVWFTQSYSKGSIPMIRMVVSNDPAPSSINDVKAEAAASMMVYPNPASDRAVLSYTLNQSGNVNLTVTDLMGRTVMTQNEGRREAGIAYKSNINVSALSNGTYFYTVEVNGSKSTNKLVVNK